MTNFMVKYKASSIETLVRFYAELQLSGAVDKTRAEKGCIRYEYFFPAVTLFDNGVLEQKTGLPVEAEMLLWEEWETREDQAAHCKTPHFAIFGQLKEKYGVTATFEVQDIVQK